MIETTQSKSPSLAAGSPFELRVNLGQDVPESDVRTALANGDMGFLHSFTTGSPWTDRAFAWLRGRQVAIGGASTVTIRTHGR